MAMISKRYFLIRTVQSFVMIWLVVTFLFFLFRFMPGDFTTVMMYRGADPETIEAFRQKWGLDDPLHVQYISYMTNLIQGDAGTSLQTRVEVFTYVKMGIFNSFILVAPAITLAYLLGSFYGLIAGTNRGSIIERYGIVPIIFAGAFPSFFIAIIMVVIFASWLGLFPTSGMLSPHMRRVVSDLPWYGSYLNRNFLWHYILPFSTIVVRYLFLPSLIMRTSVVEVSGQGFSYYQRVTGLPKRSRLWNTAKHASLPVITLYPVSMTRAIGGLVLIEIVFSWPGIGYTLVQAVHARDYPVIMFIFFLIAVFIIIANYIVDIVYGIIDPRVTVGE